MKIFSSATMPLPGTYRMVEITKEDFCNSIKNLSPEDSIQAYIGEKRRGLIKKWTGASLTSCQEDIILKKTEIILIFEMNFRIKKSDRGQGLYLPEYNFYRTDYKED